MELSTNPVTLQAYASLTAATVHEVTLCGDITVAVGKDALRLLPCSLLHPIGSAAKPPLFGCNVLVWVDAENERGVILGTLDTPIAEERAAALSDEIVIEAREALTLRVGDGSISIRADGKIVIKGKELVSRAQNVNRIRGGAVAIN